MLGQFPANMSMVTGSRSTQRPCKSPDCRPLLIQVPTRSQSHSTECASRRTITAADSDAVRPCAGHPGGRYDCDCQPASHHRRGASAGRGHRHFGNLPAPGARASGDVVEAARRYFRGQDVLVEPRNMWPSSLPDSRGKSASWRQERLGLRRRSGLGRRARSAGSARGPAPSLIMDGLVDVLRRWSRS
jgi:ATP-dependent DNA helicase RecQ